MSVGLLEEYFCCGCDEVIQCVVEKRGEKCDDGMQKHFRNEISTWVDRIVVGKIMTLNQYDLQNDKAWRELGTDDRQIEQVTIITMFLIRE